MSQLKQAQIIAKVQAAIQACFQSIGLQDGQSIYCAYSGGIDSTCLLHGLHDYVQAKQAHVTALHVNHGLQSQASTWVEHCEQVIASMPYASLRTQEVTVEQQGQSIEIAAREARWQAFVSMMEQDQPLPPILCLAHHADDQLETLWQRLLRGAGLAGLGGIPKTRMHKGVMVVRPLLGLTKADIEAYAHYFTLTAVYDRSNTDRRHDRNYLRHEVIRPCLQRWPAAQKSVAKAMQCLQSDWQWLSHYVQKCLDRITREEFGIPYLCLTALCERSHSEIALWLRVYLQKQGWYTPATARMDTLITQLKKSEMGHKICLVTKQYRMQCYGRKLYIYPAHWFSSDGLPQVVNNESGISIHVPNRIRITLPIALRSHAGVASMLYFPRYDVDKRISRKKLKQLFQAKGIPPFLRSYVPVIIGEAMTLADIQALPTK